MRPRNKFLRAQMLRDAEWELDQRSYRAGFDRARRKDNIIMASLIALFVVAAGVLFWMGAIQ